MVLAYVSVIDKHYVCTSYRQALCLYQLSTSTMFVPEVLDILIIIKE